ncbi:MAG TPA: galactokinase family protein [Gaiellaceae bacterium]|nr:galactokinase family protein [Gaiellaceae bacterium]
MNLIGDHTDYNDGYVLPLAIDLECRVVGLVTGGSLRLRWREEDADRLAIAVREALARRGIDGVGIDAEVTSTVPIGRGLSSSTAVAVALATALCAAAGISLPARDLAEACREAEIAATGVPIGIMDQVASVSGRAGHALLLDCRTHEITPVALPERIEVVVVDTGIERRLENSAYAERRAGCERVAASLGVRALRDATLEQVAGDPWARHVVSENARVLEAAQALQRADVATLGRLMVESHASLRDDFEVSTPEIDRLVDTVIAAGAAGARLTGAGFGGCIVAVVEGDALGAVSAAVPHALRVRAVDGAGPIP